MGRKANKKHQDFFNSGAGYYAGPSVFIFEQDFKPIRDTTYREGDILIGKLHMSTSDYLLNKAIKCNEIDGGYSYNNIGSVRIPRNVDVTYKIGEKAIIDFMCNHGAVLTDLDFKPEKSKFANQLESLQIDDFVLITNTDNTFLHIGNAADPRKDYKNGFVELTLNDALTFYQINPLKLPSEVKWNGESFYNNNVSYFSYNNLNVVLNNGHKIFFGDNDVLNKLSVMAEKNETFKQLEETVQKLI